MASRAPSNSMPIFYGNLEPLSSTAHGDFKLRQQDSAPHLAKIHAIPVTIDEFVLVQRTLPIVFSAGDNPVPLALMGLHEGVNVYVDDKGVPTQQMYIPAYVRRYPFMLARLRPDSDELSLCFDPTSDLVSKDGDGAALFDDGKPSEATNSILKFCEEFELSAQRTNSFMKELKELDLLMDGEVAIQPNNSDKPFIYRGFQMVSEEKFRDLRGDALRKMNQNGMLPLITAHLFSLQLVRDVFAKQMEQNKGPEVVAAPAGEA